MKKLSLIIMLLVAFAMAATAQNKKIAILETVDKKGNVPYGVCLQLRSSLTYAISSTPGYEGYDRVDMASIMGEHDFQRTGMVSDEQIQRLGEMTGCTSILVAEAAIYDANHIIITAKILDVETASVKSSVPPKVSSTKPEEMQAACEEVASKLLTVEEPPIEIIEIEVEPRTGLLTKGNIKDIYGNYVYYLDGERLTNKEFLELINSCPESKYFYEKGCKQRKTGRILAIWVPIGCVVTGAVVGISVDSWYSRIWGTVIGASAGGISALVSIPFFVNGKHKKENAYQVYNEYCAKPAKPTASLSFGPATKGIGMGIYLNF